MGGIKESSDSTFFNITIKPSTSFRFTAISNSAMRPLIYSLIYCHSIIFIHVLKWRFIFETLLIFIFLGIYN